MELLVDMDPLQKSVGLKSYIFLNPQPYAVIKFGSSYGVLLSTEFF